MYLGTYYIVGRNISSASRLKHRQSMLKRNFLLLKICCSKIKHKKVSCKICNIRFNSKRKQAKHLLSKEHLEQIKHYLEEEEQEKQHQEEQ